MIEEILKTFDKDFEVSVCKNAQMPFWRRRAWRADRRKFSEFWLGTHEISNADMEYLLYYAEQ